MYNVRAFLTSAFAVLAIVAIGQAMVTGWRAFIDYRDTVAMRTLAEVTTRSMDGTVAMSLERSVVQVALALDTPIPAAFREIVDGQRALSATAIDEAVAMIETTENLLTKDAFLGSVRERLADIDAIRAEVDALLAAPASERDQRRVYELPFELKEQISRLRGAVELLRAPSGASSPTADALRTLQAAAWEGREYGGRARTYFAIATLNEAPLRDADRAIIDQDGGRAIDAWRVVQNVTQTFATPPELSTQIDAVAAGYMGGYLDAIERVTEVSDQTPAGERPQYHVSFGDFFELSNAGLDAFARLSRGAGETLNAYWADREASALSTLLFNIAMALLVATLAFAATNYMRARIASRLKETADALKQVADGRLNVRVPGSRRDLAEFVQLTDALEAFRERARTQIALSGAVAGSTSPLLIVNQDRKELASNPAFEKLFSAMVEQSDAGFAEALTSRDFSNFFALIEAAEGTGDVAFKRDGRRAIELRVGAFTLEVKKTKLAIGADVSAAWALEIDDVTSVRALEREVMAVVEGVESGKFGSRISKIDGMGFTSFIADGLNKNMVAISAFMSALETSVAALSRGDLTAPLEGEFIGDFASAQRQFNSSLEAMRTMLAEFAAAAQDVREGSLSIASGSADLEQRAEAQARTLAGSAETATNMTAAFGEISETVTNLVGSSRASTERAADSKQVVADTVEAMGRIETSAARIREIITVIDGIAFQTNLLALNAAVEAARAGDAGKGFAVVASEVRSLAERSGEAARDIRGLIEESVAEVSVGVDLANKTGDALEGLESAVRDVAVQLELMSAQQATQATNANEISQSVRDLDSITRSNVAMSVQRKSVV